MKETMGPNWDSLINNIESKLHSILSTIEQGIVTTEDKVKGWNLKHRQVFTVLLTVFSDVDESSPLRTMLFLKQQALSHQIREQWMILLQAIRLVSTR